MANNSKPARRSSKVTYKISYSNNSEDEFIANVRGWWKSENGAQYNFDKDTSQCIDFDLLNTKYWDEFVMNRFTREIEKEFQALWQIKRSPLVEALK